jgi:hypothetical protein
MRYWTSGFNCIGGVLQITREIRHSFLSSVLFVWILVGFFFRAAMLVQVDVDL